MRMRAVLTDTIVNELSNTIDLPSTLLRAQGLFRRFQRTVEAIDKKHNFPSAPSVRQRKPAGKSPTTRPRSSGAASGADAQRSDSSPRNSAVTEGGSPDPIKERVISPELRKLLSRKVEVLDKKTVAEHGGGVGT